MKLEKKSKEKYPERKGEGKRGRLSGLSSRLLLRIISSSQASFALFITLLALALAYRLQLTIDLFTNPVKPFDFNPAHHPLWFMSSYWPSDLVLILGCFFLSWLGSRLGLWVKPGKGSTVLRIFGFVFLHLFLILLVLTHGIHARLLFEAQSGIDEFVVKEAFSNLSFFEIIKILKLKDCLFFIAPMLLFWVVMRSSLGIQIWMARISFLFILLLLSIPIISAYEKSTHLPLEIRLNPALYLITDVAENRLLRHPPPEGQNLHKMDEHRSGMHRAGLPKSQSGKPVSFLPPQKTPPWNIVFFIMESVGSRYIFDTTNGSPMPMPFLNKMAKESWHLRNHYTTANVSTKAIFSLLSGLYDFFNQKTFALHPEVQVPSLHNFLPEIYDRFWVTPSSLSWYFPTAFVRNSGLREIHSFENLIFKKFEEFHPLGRYIARDEIQTVDFFIQRLSKAREPFLGIYLSFAAHFPYFDYGADYRVREEDGRSISRYYNNLNLLDHMIKRIYNHLEERGLLERTIFIIVGDHGQAFGQRHPDNFMHYRYSYNENLETPAILHQPALFKPRAFEFPTSHVDILPTLLDAMRIPYNPVLFNGESLFHDRSRRKYLFFYGYEGSISSLDTTRQVKVQYSLKKNRCWAFDLKNDPDEKNPLDCSAHDLQLQLDALRKFSRDHDSNLVLYNAAIRENRDFNGLRHPSLHSQSVMHK